MVDRYAVRHSANADGFLRWFDAPQRRLQFESPRWHRTNGTHLRHGGGSAASLTAIGLKCLKGKRRGNDDETVGEGEREKKVNGAS